MTNQKHSNPSSPSSYHTENESQIDVVRVLLGRSRRGVAAHPKGAGSTMQAIEAAGRPGLLQLCSCLEVLLASFGQRALARSLDLRLEALRRGQGWRKLPLQHPPEATRSSSIAAGRGGLRAARGGQRRITRKYRASATTHPDNPGSSRRRKHVEGSRCCAREGGSERRVQGERAQPVGV